MTNQAPASAPSALSVFLRGVADGLKPSRPAEVAEVQRKYGFGGKLPRAVVLTLLTAFAVNAITPPARAADQPGKAAEAMAMHALAAPSAPEVSPVAQEKNPDDAGPSRLWAADKDILIIGEQHDAAGQSSLLLRDLPYLKAQGMTAFALEVPQKHAKLMEKFAEGKMDKDKLSNSMWQTPYEKLPEGFKLKLDMAEWARTNHIRVVSVDADSQLFYECASAQSQARKGGKVGYVDPNGQPEVAQRGIMQKHAFLSANEAEKEGWRLWLNQRSQAMAKNLAKDHAAHGGKIVLLVGAAHTGLVGYRNMMTAAGADLSTTPDQGIEDYLPSEMKAKTQTVLFVGGMNYTGKLEQLPQTGALHPVESSLIARGLGRQAVAIKSVQGLGSVDSVIFLPPVDTNPAMVVAANSHRQATGKTASVDLN